MRSSEISEALFGIPTERISRDEKIERIKKAILDNSLVTDEKLQSAFECLLQEIQKA